MKYGFFMQFLFAKNGLIISILTVLISILMQFVYLRYVSYEVDKVDYGNFILLQTLISGLSYIFLQIPLQAYDRFYNGSHHKEEFINEFRSLLIIINIISFLLIFIYGFVMEKFSELILILTFLYFVLLNNYTFNQKIFLLELQRGKYFYLKIMESSSKFIFPIIFYCYFKTLESFIFGIVLGYIFSISIMLFFFNVPKFYFVFNIKNIGKYFSFAHPILFVSIFTWGISFSDRYYIEFLGSTEDLAIYAILAQVAAIGQVIGQIYFIYVNPRVLKDFENDKEHSLRYISKMLNVLVLVFSLLALILFLMPINVYELIIEKKIIEEEYYFATFMILAVGIFVTIYQTAYTMYFKLYKKLNILVYIYLAALVVNLLGNIFIFKYGIIAAALSTLLSYITIVVGQIFYMKNFISQRN